MVASDTDSHFMHMALQLSERGLGLAWPNPAVGCVIVKNGRVAGRDWTMPGGRPHAETSALERAGKHADGATAYVTLEPCAHTGKTGPCVEALIDAKIHRVVMALRDPDPRVNGQGVARLREAGIQVTEGVLEAQARKLHQGFLMRFSDARPLVALKVATTLDGKIATVSGQSQWITSEQSRLFGQRLRASYDAILIGSGTLKADNPLLTCRLPGMESASPIRIVLDTHLTLQPEQQLAQSAKDYSTWVLVSSDVLEREAERAAALQALGVELLPCATSHGRLTPSRVVAILAERGITRLLIEGGPTVATAFLQAGLVDECWWFTAPIVVGDDGKGAFKPMGMGSLESSPRLTHVYQRQIGQDRLDYFHSGI